MGILLLIILVLIFFILYSGTKKPKHFPPGPPRLPVVGSLPYMVVKNKPSEPGSLLTGALRGKCKAIYSNIKPELTNI